MKSFTCKARTFKIDFHAKRVESVVFVKHAACILMLLFFEKNKNKRQPRSCQS